MRSHTGRHATACPENPSICLTLVAALALSASTVLQSCGSKDESPKPKPKPRPKAESAQNPDANPNSNPNSNSQPQPQPQPQPNKQPEPKQQPRVKPNNETQQGQGKQAPRVKPLPIPRILVQHRGDQKITVDGGLGDWPRKVMPIELTDTRQVSGTSLGAYHGEKDVSGQVYMTWDEEFLYVSAHVMDDWHRPLARGWMQQETPPVDSVVLIFDPARDTSAYGRDEGRREDRRFYLAQIEELEDKMLRYNWLTATRDKTRGGKLAIDRSDKGGLTLYEAKIPWKEILRPGEKPEHRKVIDLQVLINDYDEVTDRMPQTRVGWNFGMGLEIQPGLFGSIMLTTDMGTAMRRMPKFPDPAQVVHEKSRREWLGLLRGLNATKPAFVNEDTTDPGMVGGADRHRMLTELDGHLERFPRLDNLEYMMRIQRRMIRECAGIRQNGVPFYWAQATLAAYDRARLTPPDGVIRVIRLPQGGWYIRSKEANFMIDPSGWGVERFFNEGGVDFVIHTRPTQFTRRHEQLLIRMASLKQQRPWFTHLPFHLTGSRPDSMQMAQPFKDYQIVQGLKRITPIGNKTADGKVTVSLGYLIEWGDGRTLMTSGLSITKKEVDKMRVKPDVLIVPGLHPEAEAIVATIGPKQVLIEDAFMAEERPDAFGGRFDYEKALKLQGRIRPVPSMILAPGESVDFGKAK